jgi:CheY-like chemotaxis protein
MDKILVVEDEESVRGNLVELLKNENFEVSEAENALFALNILENDLPDLILSDIMMPYFNGFEFYDKVHKKYLDKNIPFLFLTAKMDEDTMKHAMGIGADDFITKPYTAYDLLARINKRLEKKKAIEAKFEKLKLDIAFYVPHELKTPLIPLIGLSEMMLEDFNGFSDEEKIEMIDSMHRSALRFKERIEKFTKYSELKIQETENKKTLLTAFNPIDNNFVAQVKKSYHCAERYKDIEFSLDEAELKITEADFDVMMFELVENACKFSPHRSQIKVTGKTGDNYYRIEVISEGNIISDDVLEGFNQTDRRNYQQIGNGLGFAIIKLLLKKYDVELSFDYEGKERNKLTICFPLQENFMNKK